MPKLKHPKLKALKRRKRGVPVGGERPARKGIYILPNLFTTAGLFAGFFAIVQASKGNYEAAAIAIFIALVIDGLDGRIARLTRTTSDFGSEYDSLSDMISFGLTPALVLYDWTLHLRGKLGWLVAFIYVAAVALRLARFNTQKAHDKRYFQGLPCPAAAAMAASLVWVVTNYEQRGEDWLMVTLVFTVLAALAMVSNIPYRSYKDLDLKGRVPFVVLLIMVLVLVVISFDPARVLFAMSLLYFLSGPVSGVMFYRKKRRAQKKA
ncbi:MAG TPA: CDP-diacylglycerol--serine O-phosphatidyltransferase [Acidiferrobacteraceae bacterium]|nr:CDP-diacylglycerol--serine O-phosphatidyltransferase [Acidiferrobacteraceae bacterium]